MSHSINIQNMKSKLTIFFLLIEVISNFFLDTLPSCHAVMFYPDQYETAIFPEDLGQPEDQKPFQNPLKIRSVNFSVLNVYPNENGKPPQFPYSLINYLHFRTRAFVVSREILFAPGDILNPDLLAETERNLRGLGYFRSARITYEPAANGEVDVEVNTIDSWTTKVIMSMKRKGGILSGSVGFREDNIFGLGKKFSSSYSFHPDRNSYYLTFYDPRLFGNFITTSINYQQSDDSRRYNIYLTKPFFSLMTRWSAGLLVEREERIERVDNEDSNLEQTDHDQNSAKVFMAHSPLSSQAHKLTYRVVYSFKHNLKTSRFRSIRDEPDVPTEGSQSSFSSSLEYKKIAYIREFNINVYGRDEDYNLGLQVLLDAKYTSMDLGATETSFDLTSRLTHGLLFSAGHFALGTIKVAGRFMEQDIRGVSTTFLIDYYWRIHERFTLANALSMIFYTKSEADDQYKLGAEQGLQGYKIDYFSGNKGMLLNCEGRILVFDDFLKLCTIGAVIFIDAGNAWGRHQALDPFQLHGDAGAGIRISFPRTSTGGVFKIIYSYAFDENGLGDRWLLSFGATTSF
ncbi:BamA/TamA family outer membrane protein [candidate division CSSED10-310 bacterium]|uniref:BamA/TamA family outer membrane protein n=1 Tax=candidate division CSSED10-310 bacterium TaxID=2855610 RepID=A0ABV6YWI9_UNCC1